MRRFLSTFNKHSRIITQDKSQGASQAMLYAVGLEDNDFKKGQIGIGSNWYESNPCNNHLNILSKHVKKSINDSKHLIGFRFNTIGVSDGQTNGHKGMNFSLPSREIIADSYETIVDSHLYDGNIAIPGCDKNIPACLMAMIRVNKPSFMIYGGSIKPGCFNKKEIDIVDAFQSYGNYLNDNNEDKRKGIIKNACPGSGACGGMYTANTMASALEAMGITMPGSSSFPALSVEKINECYQSGIIMENLIREDIKPLDIVTKKSIKNAITIVIALGGSTNAVLHLLAIAKTANIPLSLNDFNKIGEKVPVIGNLRPIGEHLMYHLHEVGGVPIVLKILQNNGLLYDDCLTITGKTLKENLENIEVDEDKVKHIVNVDKSKKSHIRVLYGNIAPKGCVAKISGNEGEYFSGKAKVFESENDFMVFLKTKQLNKTDNYVIVIRNQGPKGGPGMPEMLKPTSAIVGMGLKDNVAFITDGRFSGGSHGFIIGHVSPEAYDGGPISQIMDGDEITIDTQNNSITNNSVSLKSEISNTKKNTYDKKVTGYLLKYQKSVSGAEEGCVTI
jgi:dihydroxy-acid dehydratase